MGASLGQPCIVFRIGAGEREIADRHHMGAAVAGHAVAALVAECIELFDITKVERRLLFDAVAQAVFERPVTGGIERTEGQAVAAVSMLVADGENARRTAGDGDDRRIEADLDDGGPLSRHERRAPARGKR